MIPRSSSPSTSRFFLTSQWPALGHTVISKTISGEGGWGARLGFTPGLGRSTRPEPVATGQTQALQEKEGGVGCQVGSHNGLPLISILTERQGHMRCGVVA